MNKKKKTPASTSGCHVQLCPWVCQTQMRNHLLNAELISKGKGEGCAERLCPVLLFILFIYYFLINISFLFALPPGVHHWEHELQGRLRSGISSWKNQVNFGKWCSGRFGVPIQCGNWAQFGFCDLGGLFQPQDFGNGDLWASPYSTLKPSLNTSQRAVRHSNYTAFQRKDKSIKAH